MFLLQTVVDEVRDRFMLFSAARIWPEVFHRGSLLRLIPDLGLSEEVHSLVEARSFQEKVSQVLNHTRGGGESPDREEIRDQEV